MNFAKKNRSHSKPSEKKPREKDTVNVYIRSNKVFVKSARKFAKENNISMSTLVENYFRIIHERAKLPYVELPASKSLRGVLKDQGRSREDYYAYLKEKYK